MEQTNVVMAMLQTMAAQGMALKAGKGGDKAASDFQKLLDQKSQPAKSDAPVEQKPKTDGVTGKEEAPVEEDPLEQVKKLAEQGYVITQPSIAAMTLDGQTYEPGEYVIAWKGADVQFIPVAGLDEGQAQELQGLLEGMGQTIDVSDPEADALLEATDPTVEHSPAQLLEKAVVRQAGKAMEQAVEEAKPQDTDNDTQVELIDVDQGPRQIFHDVKAAPIKVAEHYEPVDTQEPEMDAKLANTILDAAANGVEKMQIQLTPANLGSITIDLTRDAGGALEVVIHATTSKAAGLLSQHLDGLHTALQSYGGSQPVHVEVQRGQEGQEQHMFQHADPDGRGQQQHRQQESRQETESSGEDFLQKLRLGLTGLEE